VFEIWSYWQEAAASEEITLHEVTMGPECRDRMSIYATMNAELKHCSQALNVVKTKNTM
jgi:hypothetical protein